MTSEVVESVLENEYMVKVGIRMYLVTVGASKDTNVDDIYRALEKDGIKASVQLLKRNKPLFVQPTI
ncbi:MAG: hypothetical protein QG670_1428 [Thermoproteota archaeon]|nr:hypothetical protein [Thermoproteota archaeon]